MAALEDLERIRECFHDNVDCNNVGGRRNPRLIAVAAGSEMMMMKLNPLENHGTTTTHLVHAVASCDGYHEKEPAAAAAAGQYSQNQLLLTGFMMALIILLFSVQALFFQTNSRSSSSLAAHNNNYQQQQQQQHFQVAYDHLSVDQVHGQTGGGNSAVRELPKNSAHEEVALIPCSGHGYMIQSNQLQQAEEEEEVAADHVVSRGGQPRVSSADGVCKCHACYGGPDCSCQSVPECIIDLDHGDPTMYEAYWLVNGASSTTVIPGWQRMSYFAAAHTSSSSRVEQQQQAVAVWFMEHELDVQIRALHAVVGNAITEGRHIVVGTGSTQLYQAALYALSSPEQSEPTSVISAAPYYSSYPVVTDYLRSALFRWAGDATTFKLQQQQSSDPKAAEEEEQQRYIELVTSPNNPDGRIQHAVVNGSGPVIHDLAYYWPHYTPITAPADHDLMLFTLSKCTGHAGTRIGWAIVKDAAVAKKMVKFVELNTIGVSQDSQIRATQILKAVIQGCNNYGHQGNKLQLQEADQDSANSNAAAAAAADPADQMTISQHIQNQNLFHYGHSIMSYRWNRLRAAVGSSSSSSSTFSLLDFSPDQCTFFGKKTTPTPAFAWLQCNKEVDCQAFLKSRGIISRSGRHFGVGPEFVRLSMLERSHSFELVVQRLASCSSPA
ncbi:hypothetical protein CY35_19G029100 [Sphagnum magellanicum]|nr:hypothetical protein CY35_19G029100 [Sphagnum magellanicum]